MVMSTVPIATPAIAASDDRAANRGASATVVVTALRQQRRRGQENRARKNEQSFDHNILCRENCGKIHDPWAMRDFEPPTNSV